MRRGRRRTRRATGTGGGGFLAAERISAAAGYSASEGGEARAAR